MKQKSNINYVYVIFFMIIMVGYLFFFSSKFIFKESSEFFSPLFTTLTGNNRNYTLYNWVYCPADGSMEIIISIDNQSYDSINTYAVSLYDRKYGFIQSIEKKVENRDMIVIRGYVPDFKELSLRISVDNTNYPDVPAEVVKFYSNINDIAKVDGIEDKKMYEYYVEKIQSSIKMYESDISVMEEEIIRINEKIENAKNSIEELEKSKSYKTESEVETIDSQISAVVTDINGFNYDIFNLQETIKERHNQIDNANLQIEDILKANK